MTGKQKAKDLSRGKISAKNARGIGIKLSDSILRHRMAPIYKKNGISEPLTKAVQHINHNIEMVFKAISRTSGHVERRKKNYFLVGVLNKASDSIHAIKRKINVTNNSLHRQGYRSQDNMNITQKEAQVLKSAKSYRVKGGSARRLMGSLRKDSKIIKSYAYKLSPGQDNARIARKALSLVKKYQTHPLYRALGIEGDVTRNIGYARKDLNTAYRLLKSQADIVGKFPTGLFLSASDELMTASNTIQRAVDARHNKPGR